MIVVSDTSPLNYLVLIEEVEVLPAIFGRVVVPPAVVEELQAPGSAGCRQGLDCGPSELARGSKSRIEWRESHTRSG